MKKYIIQEVENGYVVNVEDNRSFVPAEVITLVAENFDDMISVLKDNA